VNGCESQTKNYENGEKEISKKETDSVESSKLYVCDYLGETPPGDIPVKFAPGLISTGVDESCFDISSSGKEMIFNREGKIYLLTYNRRSSTWSEPEVLFPGGENSFSPDGKIICFNSRESFPGAKVALNVWISDKKANEWGEPFHLNEHIINQTVHALSVAENGNVYASGIIKLEYKNDTYQIAKKLSPDIKGAHPFIAPDESHIIFDKPSPTSRAADLYVVFRNSDDTWNEPVRLNDKINSKQQETNAFITPDGRYMFFTRRFDIYWVRADFLK